MLKRKYTKREEKEKEEEEEEESVFKEGVRMDCGVHLLITVDCVGQLL